MAVPNPTKISLDELIALQVPARTLDLQVRNVRARQAGQHLSAVKGRGMEFSESRVYQPGDDVRNIDWPVTARTGDTHTKLFTEEKERPVLISLDARPGMFFATRGRFKSVLGAEFAALLSWAALQAGDRVGGELFWMGAHREYRPGRGKRSLLHLLQGISQLQPEPSSADPADSMEGAIGRMRQIAHPGSLVCLISDFRGFDRRAESHLVQIARHNRVILVHLYDQLELQLPGQGRFRVAQEQRSISLASGDPKLQQAYTSRYESRVNRLQRLCRQQNLSWLECATDESPLQRLQQVFGRGRRRAHG